MSRRSLTTAIAAAVLAAGAAFAAVGTAASGSPHSGATFAYSGDNGPGFWGQLDSAWQACGVGRSQSPIDITHVRIDPALKPLKLALKPMPIALTNNGHTIDEDYEPGSTLTLAGATYQLAGVHFHTLSEHVLGDWRGVMEMHVVFKDAAANKIAVVGVLYKIGGYNRFLGALSSAGLPARSGESVHSDKEINVADGLTDTAAYYTYAGSLTTPPCTENVTWLVLKRPAELSAAQYTAFQGILGDDFRPLQAINGRVVLATSRGGKGLAG